MTTKTTGGAPTQTAAPAAAAAAPAAPAAEASTPVALTRSDIEAIAAQAAVAAVAAIKRSDEAAPAAAAPAAAEGAPAAAAAPAAQVETVSVSRADYDALLERVKKIEGTTVVRSDGGDAVVKKTEQSAPEGSGKKDVFRGMFGRKPAEDASDRPE